MKKNTSKQEVKKVTYPVITDIPCTIKKKAKDNRTYYNISITIDDMTFDVSPVFLSYSQQQRLRHAIKRLTGEEQKNANK